MCLRFRFYFVCLLAIPTLFLLSINCGKQEPLPPQVSTQLPLQKAPVYKALRKFSGKGDAHTKAVHISGNTAKLIARSWGSLDNSYTTFDMKNSGGQIMINNTMTIHTEGLENGHGEIIIPHVVPGNYYISVVTNMNWEVVVYEGM
jgi:hypothetical protein